MTSVFDMNTGTYTDYTLSPTEAVIAAYAQREKKDWNTWNYEKYRPLLRVGQSTKPGIVVVSCGNQSCLANAARNEELAVYAPDWCSTCDRPKMDCACVEHGGSY